MDNEEIKARLLYSLARKRKWGESHTAYEHMFRQLKSASLGKEGVKLAEKMAGELFRQGFILKKPTHYGLQVSLNPRMSHDIKKLIRERLGFDI